MDAQSLLALLKERSAEIIELASLRRKLSSRRNLRVKLGIDPTSPDLHLGHLVPLRILRAFQDAGHQAVLIIGDFTAQIGDPADAATTRWQLDAAEVKRNERTYLAQAGRVLDLDRAEVHHNSEWYAKMGVGAFLDLLMKFSLKSAWQRDDFQKRLVAGREVRLHEAMYHVLQAYDSVAVEAGVEIGALDQKLNMLAGRELQAKLGRTAQDIVLTPYLLGLAGTVKMSKSVGNTVNVSDTASNMFGKVMSVPDALIVHYAELAAWLPPVAVRSLRRRLRGGENPRDAKLDVAEAVTRLCHGASAARNARTGFLRLFSRRKPASAAALARLHPGPYSGLALLTALGAASSRSGARRLLSGGAVEVDGQVIPGPQATVRIRSGSVIRVGKKKFFRVR